MINRVSMCYVSFVKPRRECSHGANHYERHQDGREVLINAGTPVQRTRHGRERCAGRVAWVGEGHLQLQVLGLLWVLPLRSLRISSAQHAGSGRGCLMAGRSPVPTPDLYEGLPEFHAATPEAGDPVRTTGRG